jgi:hypothetical protein
MYVFITTYCKTYCNLPNSDHKNDKSRYYADENKDMYY